MYQGIPVVKLSDYNKYLAFRGFDQLHLADNQYLITCDMGDTLDDMFNSILSAGTTITLGGKITAPVHSGIRIFENEITLTDGYALWSKGGGDIEIDDKDHPVHIEPLDK